MKKKVVSLCLASAMLFSLAACNKTSETNVSVSSEISVNAETVNALVGTDALGRNIEEIVTRKQNREVGLFYFLWLGQHGELSETLYDIQTLTDMYGESLDNVLWNAGELNEQGARVDTAETELESGLTDFHYWGEPLYGYYNSGDPWVIRKHLELFVQSGIDFLVMDITNGSIYLDVMEKVMLVIDEMIDDGWNPPRIILYTNTNSASTIMNAYNQIYKKGLYPRTWYIRDGKPAIIGSSQVNYENITMLPQEIKDFFTLIPGQFPYEAYESDAWPWIDWAYPQYTHNGMVNVSVSQHVNHPFSNSVYPGWSMYNANWGRGWDFDAQLNLKENILSGSNLQAQWATALDENNNVDTVFVTGWNEWVAQKLLTDGRVQFVDTVNVEFSRDLEMMKGGYGDNYYLQNMMNVRAFQAAEFGKNYTSKASGSLADSFDWSGVGKTYRDVKGEAIPRDYAAAAKYYIDYSSGSPVKTVMPNYVDNSARNDIVSVQTTADKDNLWIRVETAKAIQLNYSDPLGNCMNIFLSVEGANGGNWEGYEYLINRTIFNESKTSLHKATGNGFEFVSAGAVDYSVNGKYMTVKIPLSLLGVKGSTELTLDLKVADNVTDPSDIMSYYTSGDSAPAGRLSYRYNVKL